MSINVHGIEGRDNTTTAPLAGDATYTGEWENSDRPDVLVAVEADADGTLYFEFSDDAGSNVVTHPAKGYPVVANVPVYHVALKGPRDFRVRYVNGSAAQTELRLYTYYGSFNGSEVSAADPLPISLPAFASDAFGRIRVSATGQRLDGEFIYNKQDDYFDETTNNGTVTHNANARDLTLSVSAAANGDFAKIESYPVPYTPGNSQLIDITGVLDLAAIGGGTAECFVRTSVSGSAVTTTYAQSTWDSLTAGVDWTKSHIFTMDFQSLKVGSIRFGLVRNGVPVIVKQVNNDNSINTGYWQLANGCAYWHLYSDGTNSYMEIGYGNEANAIGFRYKITANASATMKAICCTVKSEGGEALYDMPGLPRAISNQQTTVTASTTLVPILSIRPKALFNSKENMILGIPKSWQVQTSQPIRVVLLHDATLTNDSWADVDTSNSMMEYDVSATALSGGHEVDEVYIATAGAGANSRGSQTGPLGKTLLWNRQDAVTGILTVAAIRTTASDAAVLATMRWEELR